MSVMFENSPGRKVKVGKVVTYTIWSVEFEMASVLLELRSAAASGIFPEVMHIFYSLCK